MAWGRRGWTATLYPRDEARAAAGQATCYVGSWGGHVVSGGGPDGVRQPVKAGRAELVLALSGEADGYNGWGRALHKEAGAPNEALNVVSGRTTIVEMLLTIGPPTRVRRMLEKTI